MKQFFKIVSLYLEVFQVSINLIINGHKWTYKDELKMFWKTKLNKKHPKSLNIKVSASSCILNLNQRLKSEQKWPEKGFTIIS